MGLFLLNYYSKTTLKTTIEHISNCDKSLNLNIKFNGSYYFLHWVLKKYKTQLPYNGELKQFALQSNYSEKSIDKWRVFGVGNRVWNILHKDLTILYLTNKIPIANLFELEKMYESWKKDDTISINNYK